MNDDHQYLMAVYQATLRKHGMQPLRTGSEWRARPAVHCDDDSASALPDAGHDINEAPPFVWFVVGVAFAMTAASVIALWN